MQFSPSPKFGKVRSFLWPIHRHELKKLIPMFLMLFLVCFNYSTLRNMKDALVITAASSGAEVIPFIKVWVMLPMAVLLTFVFARLSNRYSQEKVFYIMTTGFLIFFAIFTFILYPIRETIHLHQTAEYLEKVLPAGSKGFITMCRNWTFTAFYVMSELWGSIVLTVLFWGFANEVTKISEARRFYSVFGIGSNVAAIVAGQVGVYLTNQAYNPGTSLGKDAWEQTLILLISVIICSGILLMMIFRWMNKNVLNDPSFDDLHLIKKEAKAKGKLSVKESFSYLSNSKYLICIAVIVVSYNLVINLVEVVWKDQLKQLYPSPTDYNNYMNNLTSMIGVVSTITAFFMARIIARFGWTNTAMITPAIMLVTSVGFFSFLLFGENLAGVVGISLGMTPLAIAVFFGATQNCLSKAAKYSVFDTTKEMSFIPLSHESKLKGKAAIDGVGSRLGKSGGSVIHQGLLMIFGTFAASMPYLAGFLMLMIFVWIVAIKSLGKKFNALVATKALQEKVEVSGEAELITEEITVLSHTQTPAPTNPKLA